MSDQIKKGPSDECNYSTPAPQSFMVYSLEHERVVDGLLTEINVLRRFQERRNQILGDREREQQAEIMRLHGIINGALKQLNEELDQVPAPNPTVPEPLSTAIYWKLQTLDNVRGVSISRGAEINKLKARLRAVSRKAKR